MTINIHKNQISFLEHCGLFTEILFGAVLLMKMFCWHKQVNVFDLLLPIFCHQSGTVQSRNQTGPRLPWRDDPFFTLTNLQEAAVRRRRVFSLPW